MTGAQPDDVTTLARYLEARTGLRLDGPRQIARLRTAVSRSGHADAAVYVALLQHDDAAYEQLVAEVTVAESYFFREPGHFAALRTTILPGLLAQRAEGHVLRLWSAGCAGGEEPYSLAIVLDQAGLADRSRILATDLSRSALERARMAVYADWSLRALDGHQRRLWFRPVVGGHRLHERYARRVTFRCSGLLDRDPVDRGVTPTAADFDVILCRNVLVHLTPGAVRQAAARLVAALAPEGWLITGAGDPPLPPQPGVEAVSTPQGIVYRRDLGRPATAPPETRARPQGRVAGSRRAASDQPDERTPLDPSQHLLRATLLLETGRPREAAIAARAAAYLRPDLAAAHLTLGVAELGAGNLRAAHAAFRTAGAQLATAPPDQVVPLSGGERAGRLLQLAADHARRTGMTEAAR